MATNYPSGLDSFNNPSANTPENATGYEHDLQHSNVNDAIEAIEAELGVNPSGTYSSVAEAIANAKPKETIWTPYGTPVWADEFNGTIDPSWTHVYPSGGQARSTITNSNGVVSVYHNSTTDGAGVMHALLIPISGRGGDFVAGDALVTAVRHMGVYNVQYHMIGVGVTNGVVHGTSNAAHAQIYTGGGVGYQTRVNYNAGMSADTGTTTQINNVNTWTAPFNIRLVMTAANTWRCDLSPDGISWLIGNVGTYTLTPTHMGLFWSLWASTTPFVVSFEFIRRYSGVS